MTETTNTQETRKPAVVFYDDRCGACDRLALGWRRWLEPVGVHFIGLSDPRVAMELGPVPEGLVDRMPVRDHEGRFHWGFDALLWLLQSTPRLRGIGRFLAFRAVRPGAERVYLFLAQRRRRISTACGLEPNRTRRVERHHAATTFLEEP